MSTFYLLHKNHFAVRSETDRFDTLKHALVELLTRGAQVFILFEGENFAQFRRGVLVEFGVGDVTLKL